MNKPADAIERMPLGVKLYWTVMVGIVLLEVGAIAWVILA